MTLVDDTRTVRAYSDERPLPQGAQLSPLDAMFRIAVWERAYPEGGVAALQPHWLKRRSVMEKQTDQNTSGEDPDDAGRTRKELLEELQQMCPLV